MRAEAEIRQHFVRLTTAVACVVMPLGILLVRVGLGPRLFPPAALGVAAGFVVLFGLLHLASRRTAHPWTAAALLAGFLLLPVALALLTPESAAPIFALPVVLLLPVVAAGSLLGSRASVVVAGLVVALCMAIYALSRPMLSASDLETLRLTYARGLATIAIAAAMGVYFADSLARLIGSLRASNAALDQRNRLHAALAELGRRALEGPAELGASTVDLARAQLGLAGCCWLERAQAGAAWATRAGQAPAPLPPDDALSAASQRPEAAVVCFPQPALAVGLPGPCPGLLLAFAPAPRTYSEDERHFFESAAGLLTAALARKEARQQQARAEEQLRSAQKMEALGQLAGGIAHDFNNMLTVMMASGGLLARHPLSPSQHELVSELNGAAERAGALTRQLLTFSRRQAGSPRVLDLNALLGALGALLRRLIGEDIELEVRLAPKLGKVFADPSQVEQALVNLVVNARAAMPRGGHLRIETSSLRPDERRAEPPLVGSEDWVHLEVADTGSGMSAQVLARVFEPFFSTKAPGEGTGLGLAMVHSLAQQSGGHVWAESTPGKGTVFHLVLPAHSGVAAAAGAEERGALVEGKGSVLVVEDDRAVQASIEAVLRAAGYTVTSVGRPLEAAGLVASSPFDLVVTDVVMPGLSGPELVEELRRHRPAQRVLFVSAFVRTRPELRALLEGEAFLPKPFTPEALTRAVRDALARGPAA